MPSTPSPPTFPHLHCASRFLPNRIDDIAHQTPTKPFISLPKSDNLAEGFKDITYAQFANAINGAAWFLDERLGKADWGKGTFETMAYIGPNDLRYLVLIVAGMKVGRKLMSASPWTSIEGKKNLFRLTSCNILLQSTSPATRDILEELDQALPKILKRIEVPALSEWLNDDAKFPLYPYTRTWEEGINDPVVVFHTSGTTGMPKPLIYTNATIQCFDFMSELRHTGQHLSTHDMTGRRIYVAFSMPHLGGFGHLLLYPLYFSYVGISAPQFFPSAEILSSTIKTTDVSAAVIYPALIEDFARRDPEFEELRKLEIIWWGGAPLSKTLGDRCTQVIDLRTKYGTTEMAWPGFEIVPGKENWQYVKFWPGLGMEFVPYGSPNPSPSASNDSSPPAEAPSTTSVSAQRNGEEGGKQQLYELRLIRSPAHEPYQIAFHVHPSQTIHYTGDLWLPHPDPNQEGLWKYKGRVDDMAKLATGQSVRVAELELKISACPLVTGVLVTGSGKHKLCLVLEVAEGVMETVEHGQEGRARVLDEIWPWVEEANRGCTENGKLVREFVLLVRRGRLRRLLKGTVDRMGSEEVLRGEVEEIYKR